jgi:hypothetical protein
MTDARVSDARASAGVQLPDPPHNAECSEEVW